MLLSPFAANTAFPNTELCHVPHYHSRISARLFITGNNNIFSFSFSRLYNFFVFGFSIAGLHSIEYLVYHMLILTRHLPFHTPHYHFTPQNTIILHHNFWYFTATYHASYFIMQHTAAVIFITSIFYYLFRTIFLSFINYYGSWIYYILIYYFFSYLFWFYDDDISLLIDILY